MPYVKSNGSIEGALIRSVAAFVLLLNVENKKIPLDYREISSQERQDTPFQRSDDETSWEASRAFIMVR